MLLLENISHDELKKNLKELYGYCTQFLKIDRVPKVIFKKDKENAEDIFGKTGYYDPDKETIVLFITNRHPKDVLRSFAHELVHHEQKCTGKNDTLDMALTTIDPAYAMHNKGLRELEQEAFTNGNLLFRDWCDTKKMERENNMSESKKKIDLVLKKVIERLIKESKESIDVPKKDEPEFKKIRGKIYDKIKSKKGIKPGAVATSVALKSMGLKNESEKEAKPDFLDLNKDGDTTQSMKDAAKDAKEKGLMEDDSFTSGETVEALEEIKKMKCEACGAMYEESKKHMCKEVKKESKEMPYKELFNKKDRLFNERFSEYEQWKFEELLKKAIKK